MNEEKLHDDEFWMKKSIALSREALNRREVPIGAVFVSGNRILGSYR